MTEQLIPAEAVDQDWQCTKVADAEYGWELRCSLEADHDGGCKP